ncbi:MAG TPA: hypothetical protein VJA23_02810 [Candidatus Nanoarchaeia archaeon]|nr:hypothetical protein [Candidatus Nanoarchaeia archaeon]
MENLLLIQKSTELEELSQKLGFTKTLFLDQDLVLVRGKNQKELLDQIKTAKRKNKLAFYQPETEEMLRFALEHTPIDLVFGMEKINPSDSLHYLRGGLDQIICKIAAEKEKTIGFSFQQILTTKNPEKMIARMKFNLKLCRKYKVKTFFNNFSFQKEELRSAQDLEAFLRVLGKN